MPPRTVLVVALHTPPSPSSGARRPAGLTKYLSRLGYRVIVLTSTFSGSGPVPGAARTIRTRDLLTSRFNWRRSNVGALTREGNAGEVAPPSVLERYAIPDVQLAAWLPFALPRALRLLREERIDAVLTTGPPHSVHLIGAALTTPRRAWLLEMRDGWTYQSSATPGLGATSLPARWLERALVRRADVAIAISAPLVRDLVDRCGANGVVVPLAYDPEEMQAADEIALNGDDPLLDPAKTSIVYTGSIVEVDGSSAAFLEGLHRVRARRPDAERLEVVVVGPVRTDVRSRVQELDLGEAVRFVGSVDRVRALALQRSADALLVLAAHAGTGILTNKVVEYLVTGKPVIVLGENSEAGRLVAERGAGIVVPRTDPDATAAALERLLDGRIPIPASQRSDDMSYPGIARQLAALIEGALPPGSRSGRG